jgi:uncharacterized membrane protein
MLIASRVYDLLIFIHGNNNPFLERQIKVFVVTSLIFIVIIYFVYAISLPTDNDGAFKDLFFFIAIFEIIVSLLLMCSLLLYVKRIIAFNQSYGRYAFFLGVVFIAANVLSGSINFVIGSQGFENVQEWKKNHIILWCILFIPFYIITEFLPACTFALVMSKYHEVVHVQ